MHKILPKSLNLRKETAHALVISVILVFIGVGGFGLGRLSALGEKTGRVVIHGSLLTASVVEATPQDPRVQTVSEVAASPGGATSSVPVALAPVVHNFVASKNGTKYYAPTCSGAARIKLANQVWFTSRDDAKAAGYTPSAMCPQLK